jgi:hypothetical protein
LSVFQYNGITIPNARISNFEQRALYEAETDWYLTQFSIKVEGTFNLNYISMIAPDLASANCQNAADVMKSIRARLLTPRQTLSVMFGSTQLIPVVTGGRSTTCDASNGPRPQYCNIIQLMNQTFIISFAIVAHYWENNFPENSEIPQNIPGNAILYNRWSESVNIDDRNYTIRTRRGKFVIRSDNSQGNTVDFFREQMAVVGVPTGFLRKSSNYMVDPSGLGLQYEIVDQEVYKKPPSPAFKASGYYREYCEGVGFPARIGECTVKLWGDSNTNQADLVNLAIDIARSRVTDRGATLSVPNGQPANPGTAIIQPLEASVYIDLYDNMVEFTYAAQLNIDTSRKNALQCFANMSTATPFNDPTYVPDYQSRGTAQFLLLAAAYYDPSLTSTILDPTDGQMSTGSLVGNG